MDVMTAILNRRSVRSYAPRPIPPEVLDRMRTALRAAPSACNLQPWHFIFVSDERLRGRLARAAFDQLWIATAPIIVVACGLPRRAYQHMGGPGRGHSADIDVAIAVDHLTLAAVAEGLGTCWIGAFDEATVKHLLGVPPDAKVVALTPLGYPASPDLNHPLSPDRRRPPAEVFSTDRWGQP